MHRKFGDEHMFDYSDQIAPMNPKSHYLVKKKSKASVFLLILMEYDKYLPTEPEKRVPMHQINIEFRERLHKLVKHHSSP